MRRLAINYNSSPFCCFDIPESPRVSHTIKIVQIIIENLFTFTGGGIIIQKK